MLGMLAGKLGNKGETLGRAEFVVKGAAGAVERVCAGCARSGFAICQAPAAP